MVVSFKGIGQDEYLGGKKWILLQGLGDVFA